MASRRAAARLEALCPRQRPAAPPGTRSPRHALVRSTQLFSQTIAEDVNPGRRMAERGEVLRILPGGLDTGLGLFAAIWVRVGRVPEPRRVAIKPSQEARIIRAEHEDAHQRSDSSNPAAYSSSIHCLAGAAAHVAPPIPLRPRYRRKIPRDRPSNPVLQLSPSSVSIGGSRLRTPVAQVNASTTISQWSRIRRGHVCTRFRPMKPAPSVIGTLSIEAPWLRGTRRCFLERVAAISSQINRFLFRKNARICRTVMAAPEAVIP